MIMFRMKGVCREKWVQAIKSVSEKLANDCEDVEMNPPNQDSNSDMVTDLWEKCSLQGLNVIRALICGII